MILAHLVYQIIQLLINGIIKVKKESKSIAIVVMNVLKIVFLLVKIVTNV